LKTYTFTAFIDPVLKLGDVIKVYHPRYGFATGGLLRVIGYQWQPLDQKLIIEAIG
jgi:hypothetical protein